MSTSDSRLILPPPRRLVDPGLSRRSLLRSAVSGAAGLIAGQLLPVSAMAAGQRTGDPDEIRPAGMGLPGSTLRTHVGPPSFGPLISPTPNRNRLALAKAGGPTAIVTGVTLIQAVGDATIVASAGGTGSLSNITNVLTGPGLYIGNEFEGWSDATRQQVFHQIASWGFEWVCPKVGGYASTWYTSDQQLRNWRTWANNAGLAFAPFIYSIPSTAVGDARICSEIANDCGIAIVDMESEWESSTNAYSTEMKSFGDTYRGLNPTTPIIVTGFGDPTYAFGTGGWPYTAMTLWADGYSPQWYYGDWDTYDGKTANVTAAVNWGDGYCASAFGDSFPLIPSLSVYSGYSPSVTESGETYLPNSDIIIGANYTKLWKAPVIWWEYQGMTASRAAACLA